MIDPRLTVRIVLDLLVHHLHGADSDRRPDRGAVSIEQVLWYAAAAVSVAVVAAIVWSQIRTTASTPVQSPSAP